MAINNKNLVLQITNISVTLIKLEQIKYLPQITANHKIATLLKTRIENSNGVN